MSQSQNYDEKHTETAAREKATQTMREFQQGNLPENKELLEGVDLIEQKLREVNPKLSRTGQKASRDVQNILENTREIIEKKNEDEHLQKAYKHAQSAGKGMSYQQRIGQLRNMLGGVNTKELTTEARENIKSFFTIVKLAFLSPEFRRTTNDFFTLFGDMISRQSEKGEERLRSKQEGSEQEGYPEPKHGYEWIEREGTYSLQRSSKRERSQGGLSREQEDKLVDRMVDLLQTFHKYPEYSNSITYISNSIKKLSRKLTEGKQIMDSAARADSRRTTSDVEHHQQRSKQEMLMFLENWIGEDYSFDNFIQTLVKFRRIVESDSELKQLFKDLRIFFTKSAQDSSYVDQREKVREDSRDLINRTRFFLFDKYRDEFRTLKKEIQYLNRSIQHDETTEKLRGNMKQLIDHLLMDSAGNPTLKPELLSDAQILLQVVFKTLKYIPLPPIRKETPNGGSFELDNLVISCTDILPSQIHLGATLDAEKVGSNVLELKLRKVRAHIRNAKFFIDKRDGFPKMKESGFIDVDIRGKNGMTVEIELQPERVSMDENKTIESLFRVRSANCSISKLNLRFRDTKHDGLYKFLGPVINLMARKRIENLVRDQIVETIKQINTTSAKAATQALRQTDVAKEKASKIPAAAQKSRSKAKSKGKKLEKDTRPSEQKREHSPQRKSTSTHDKPHEKTHHEKTHHEKTHEKPSHGKSPRGVVDTTPITSGPSGQSSSGSRGVVDTTPITSGSGVGKSSHEKTHEKTHDKPSHGKSSRGVVDTTPITSGSGGQSSSGSRGIVDTTPITSGSGSGVGKSSSHEKTHEKPQGMVDTTPITSSSGEKPQSSQRGIDTTPITSGGSHTSPMGGTIDTTPISSGGEVSSKMPGSSPSKKESPLGGEDLSRAPGSFQGGYVDSSVIPPTSGSSSKSDKKPSGHGVTLGTPMPPSSQ
jgi:uncharacterized protein YktA (UPF0223 family)